MAELPRHNISAASLSVVQNDDGNVEASVTVTAIISVNDFRPRAGGNSKGDFTVQIGSDATDDPTNGILMSCVSENGRDNYAAGFKTNCVSMVDFNANGYFIPVNGVTGLGAGANPEFNINVAGAYFPYTTWLGGFAKNGSTPVINGGPLDSFTASPSLVLGTHFVDLGGGRSIVNLTNLGIDSRIDGVLLVSGAKNESSNYGQSRPNTTNGTWNLNLRDAGANAAALEQDPIAFVFIPKTNTTVVSGRFLGNGTIAMFSGNSPAFTVSSNSAGTYELKITGYSPTNGVLIISPEGGEPINQDNFVQYEINPAKDGWIIQTRDCPATALESPGATEGVVSFVFIPGPTPGFSVTPTNNLFTSESGGQANFTVALHKQPQADVTIAVSSGNTAEGTVSTNSLTFTSLDWNIPQTVTITGMDDAVADGSVAYTIILAAAVSVDANYNGLKPSNVSVVNTDNEGGITVAPTIGLTTTEAGGQATFTVRLNTQPTGDVTIGLSSSNTGEGTVSPVSLTFTSGNWDQEQTVTITGVDDFVDEGNVAYTIITAPASSSDSAYNGLNAADVSVSNIDNDTAGLQISAAGPNGLQVVEGKTNGYTVALTSQPTANVTVNIASSNTSQGGTVSPAILTFTSLNWSNAQSVTVTGADDFVPDGDTAWTITNSVSSSDPVYAALSPVPVLMTTFDNEAVLTLPSGDLIYGIGLAGVGIDGRATIVAPNTANYNSGTLTVTLTANGTADDRLEIRNTGTGAGQIGVSGSTVSFGGTAIGTFAGGVGTTPLVVTFNSSATPAAGEALLRSVTFRNISITPSTNRRSVSVTLAHSDGGTSSVATGIRVSLLRASDFQDGADHGYGDYSSEADIQLREADPLTPYPAGSAGGLFIDFPDAGVHNAFHTLMRFDDIFGNGFGQIPTNAVIVSADLILRIPPEDANSMGDGSPLYRMLIPFDATNATWSSTGNGIDQDEVESRSTADSELGLVDGSGDTKTGSVSISVLPDIKVWQSGVANYGWVMPGWVGNTDGTTISPSESANISDRPRLRVKWLPEGTASVSFRQNVNGYTNAADTRIRAGTPDTQYSTVATVFSDWEVTAGQADQEHVLMRFDNIIGTDPNQIPPGATIHAAVLDLASRAGSAQGHGGHFHAMLEPWQDTNTWNYFVNGVQADDVEAASAISAAGGTAALLPFVQGGFNTFELTSDVQAWVNNTRPNYGWVILPWPNGGDGWGIGTAESVAEVNRPQLRVYYTPALAGITILSVTRTSTTAVIRFSGVVGNTYSVLRAGTVTGPYNSIGTATVGGDGTATFTDNAPLASMAYYRVSFP